MIGSIKKRHINKYLLYIVISTMFVLLLAPYTTVLNDYFGIDTAQYWVIGNGILHGKIPYVDLFDHKGPMIFLLWGLGIFIGQGTKWGIFILESISLSISTIIIDKLCALYSVGLKKTIAIQVLFYTMLCGTIVEGGLTEEWALPCSLYALYCAIRYFRNTLKGSIWNYAFMFGVLFAFVGWMRLNNAVLIGAIILVLVIHMISNHKYLHVLKCGMAFSVGIAIVTLPIVGWFVANQAFDELVFGSFVYNFKYASGGLTEKDVFDWIKTLINVGVLIILLLWAFYRNRKTQTFDDVKSSSRDWEMVLALTSSILTALSCMLGYTWQHYFMLYLPCIVYGFILIMERLKLNGKACIIVILALMIPYAWQISRNIGKNVFFNVGGYYDEVFTEIRRLEEIIPENERDSVWSIGWTSSKYYAANDLLPCYKVFDFPAVLSSRELYEDTVWMLKNEPPLWIMRFSDGTGYIKELDECLNTDYELTDLLSHTSNKRINIGQQIHVEIWKRKY